MRPTNLSVNRRSHIVRLIYELCRTIIFIAIFEKLSLCLGLRAGERIAYFKKKYCCSGEVLKGEENNILFFPSNLEHKVPKETLCSGLPKQHAVMLEKCLSFSRSHVLVAKGTSLNSVTCTRAQKCYQNSCKSDFPSCFRD